MQKAAIYRQNADMCRKLASGMKKKDAQVLLQLAAHWDSRAEEVERAAKKKEVNKVGN